MSYLVLARKWRPQDFDTITGQEHVTRTLANAIEQDRVHHAFLFCGARGVGKTSAARVLARALNCDQGPTQTPCGECRPCREIAATTAIDVLEIDGASNRGINEIRELRDGVAYAPQRDRTKIYIIDEVHMLTTEAFNALLKTLEEPPPHVKFIFATTEPQKIPVTILSRCQRFDFKRIPLRTMVERLSQILEAEEVSIDKAGLGLVARESEGSMRDALSLLDRIISFCGKEADYQKVAEILGVADRSWLRKLVASALAHDAVAALEVVAEVFHYGSDLKQFASDLVHYLRDIVVLRVTSHRRDGKGASLTDLADEETKLLAKLGQAHSVEDLERLFNLAVATAERLSQASFPRLELEMAVVRMCLMRPLQPVGHLISRLESLERHLATGTPLPPLAGPDTDPGGAAPPPATREPQAAPPGHQAAMAPAAPEPVLAPEATSAAQPPPEPAAPPDEPEPEEAALPAEEMVAVPAEEPPPGEPAEPIEVDHDGWEAFVDEIRPEQTPLAGTLDRAQVLGVSGRDLRIGFERGTASVGAARERTKQIEELARGWQPGLGRVLIEEIDRVEHSPWRRRELRHRAQIRRRRKALEQHPTVRDVVARFDGTLKEIVVEGQE